MHVYWDLGSAIIYIIVGLVGLSCITLYKKNNPKKNIWIALWFIIWTFFAVFREVTIYTGGADALSYINYFNNCLIDIQGHFAQDIIFKIFNQSIRIFSSDYHIYFAIYNLILLISYFLFIKEFLPKNSNNIPLFLVIYIFLRGFVTMRTNLAVAMILLGLVLLKKQKKMLSILFIISSFFIQKASILYSFFIIFYIIYKSKTPKIKELVLYMILITGFLYLIQSFLINDILNEFHGSYAYYAKLSIGTSFFSGFWKIAFEQLLLLSCCILLRKDFNKYLSNQEEKEKEKISLVYKICIFDFITIPATYIVGIWRGYEYLYLPRLILWCVFLYIIQSKFDKKGERLLNIIFIFIFISWFLFRLYNTYEDSKLLPYALDFFSK